MGFSAEAGYVPLTINDIMSSIMVNINEQFGTSYTIETFVGTNLYKYFYALAQRVQENEIKASEVFLKLQDYFDFTNETIIRPKVTPDGIIDALALEGYTASVKPMVEGDAGKSHICVDVGEDELSTLTIQDIEYEAKVRGEAGVFTVIYEDTNTGGAASVSVTGNAITVSIEGGVTDADTIVSAIEGDVDANALVSVSTSSGSSAQDEFTPAEESVLSSDYEATKLAICELIKQYTPAGIVTVGTEVETLTLTNGQSFDFAYNLPTRTEVELRLTLTLSRNNQVVIGDPDDTKLALLAKIKANYKLGKDFEPDRYFSVADAPWASDVLLEYRLDGVNWLTAVYESDYDELFTVLLENITLIES